MANSKQTKRALLTSALAILACVAMLIGSTFAWFTDTASTAVNRIEAGTLKLKLEYATAWDSEGNVKKWEDAKNATLSFIQKTENGYAANADILWEPGATYRLQQLRISNVGNLALKYKVVISGIGGSAKLNEVIDWTIELDGGAYTLGQAHHLAAKSDDAVDTDVLTVVGKMQETAGNEYQGEKIDGISVTVYAVQDTVESDSFDNQYDAKADGGDLFDWNAAVAVTGTVAADADTTLKDREVDPTVTAVIPADSTTAEKLTLIKTKADAPADLTITAGNETVTADVKLVDQDGNKVTAQNGKFFTLTMQLEPNRTVAKFYHHSTALKAATSVAKLTENDQYYYDTKTGVVTFTTDDFSPFTAEYALGGGNGTKAYPYLIATGEQAYQMRDENAKGYFKLVKDVVVTNEIYLSGKTVVVDLNGHSIKLAYADGVTPNNGGVFNISGKKSSLTINDSSAEQTGAVIGSDKTYANKVTSAVRVGNYGKLTINGGHFYGTSAGTSCIFVMTSRSSGSKATVVINGGEFETATPNTDGTYYVLNHQDSATTGCTITVNGGSFKNYEPGVTVVDPVNAYTGKISLGTGCTTTSEEVDGATWYTVSK